MLYNECVVHDWGECLSGVVIQYSAPPSLKMWDMFTVYFFFCLEMKKINICSLTLFCVLWFKICVCSLSLVKHLWLHWLVSFLEGSMWRQELQKGETERFWFTLKIVAVARARLAWGQEPGCSWSATWVLGPKHLKPSSPLFPVPWQGAAWEV